MRDAMIESLAMGAVVLLGVWLLLTMCNQVNLRWMRLVRHLDVMLLIPRWTFFAPNPGLSDFHLSVRTLSADGTASAWEEIDGIAHRTLRSALWNPEKRVTKAVIEVASALAPLCRDHPERVASSAPYRCLLNHALRAAARSGRAQAIARCEFRLTETPPRRGPVGEPFEYQSAPIALNHAEP
jgi:hypothetical protein